MLFLCTFVGKTTRRMNIWTLLYHILRYVMPYRWSIPPTAQAFIDKYFPHTNVVLTETDDEDDGIEYCVWLNDGTKIEFDAEGQWQRVSRQA